MKYIALNVRDKGCVCVCVCVCFVCVITVWNSLYQLTFTDTSYQHVFAYVYLFNLSTEPLENCFVVYRYIGKLDIKIVPRYIISGWFLP